MENAEQTDDHFNHRVDYYVKWDSDYCRTCKIWLDDPCSDPNCEFCTEPRPRKP